MTLSSNILTTFSTRIAGVILALISSIMLARVLGPDGRGLLALVMLLPELAVIFGLLGFEQANAVYAGLEPAKRRALIWQSLITASVVGGIIAFASACFIILGAPGFEELIRGPLWLYLLALAAVPAKIINAYWLAILRGMNHILLLNAIEFGTKSVSVIFIIVLVGWLHFDVAGAVWANVSVSLIAVIVLVSVFKYLGPWSGPSFDWLLWKRASRFALPAYFGTVLSYFNYRVDQLIVAALLPPAQLAFYVIAVGLAERLWILTGSVSTALLPHLTNSREKDPRLSAIIARHVMVWTGVACFIVFALAEVAVRIMYSSAFVDAVAPLRWMLPGVFMLSVGKILVSEILAREKVYVTMWIAAAAAIMNIIGNFLLIPHMGIAGAALASSFSYSLVSLMIVWIYVRETGVPLAELVPHWNDRLAYIALWQSFRAARMKMPVRGSSAYIK